MHVKENPFPKAGSKIQNNFLIFIDHLTCTKLCAGALGNIKVDLVQFPCSRSLKSTSRHGSMAMQVERDTTPWLRKGENSQGEQEREHAVSASYVPGAAPGNS